MLTLLSSLAFAGSVSPPESWYILDKSMPCQLSLIVGADGVPVGAPVETCSAALEPALQEEVLSWRLAPGPERVEPVEVMVKRPEYQPKTYAKGVCLVVVQDGRVLSKPDSRCDVAPRPLPAATPTRPGQTSWCAVDVDVRDGEIAARPAGCSESFTAGVEEVVRGWAFPTERDRSWRVLLGATGPATGS